MPATLKDVAALSGVSIATASRALNNKEEVSPQTRARVLQAAEQLGYVPNSLAKGLLSGQSRTIGVLITNITNPFYAIAISEIEDYFRTQGYNILLTNSHEDPQRELEAVKVLLKQRVDGIILAPVQSTPEVAEILTKNSVPYVLVGRTIPGINANSVVCDDFRIGQLAAEHLISRGHKRILVINAASNHSAFLRLEGFKAVLARHRLPLPDSFIRTVGTIRTEELVHQALEDGLQPTAIFCFCDDIAVDVVRALHRRQIMIPQEIAVVGVDNLRFTELFNPPLTTVDTQPKKMGFKAAELLLKKLRYPQSKPEQIVLEPIFIRRNSS